MKLLYKKWDEVPLNVYSEFVQIRNTVWESDIQQMIEEISLFADCAPDDEFFDDITLKDLYALYAELKWTKFTPKGVLSPEIKERRHQFFPIELQNLSLGAYIDCNHYLKNEQLLEIFAIIYRQKEIGKWGHTEIEPYKYNLEERKRFFKNAKVTEIFGVINYFKEWHQEIQNKYSSIFADPDWDKIEGEEQLPPEEVAQIKKEIAQDKQKAPFSWLGIVWELSNHDIANFSQVFEVPVILAFNVLSMRKALKI